MPACETWSLETRNIPLSCAVSLFRYFETFGRGSRVWQTDGQTERHSDSTCRDSLRCAAENHHKSIFTRRAGRYDAVVLIKKPRMRETGGGVKIGSRTVQGRAVSPLASILADASRYHGNIDPCILWKVAVYTGENCTGENSLYMWELYARVLGDICDCSIGLLALIFCHVGWLRKCYC